MKINYFCLGKSKIFTSLIMLTNKEVLAEFSRYFNIKHARDIMHGSATLELPTLQEPQLVQLINDSKELFINEDILLKITSPCIVVGDLHGHVLDLFRIIALNGLPDFKTYLFLGDIVDRGEFSLETLELILLLKVCYPNTVFVIRGNHEFSSLCSDNGFQNEINSAYPQSNIYSNFMDIFAYLPLAAIIDGDYLCVHGGIGPTVKSIEQILMTQRPIDDYNNEFIKSVLWSDPSDIIQYFHPSRRGTGYFFGEDALKKFLKENNMKILIRGHECVTQGVIIKFHDTLVTVFSASNYCGTTGNQAGIMNIKSKGKYEIQRFKPLRYITRDSTRFYSFPPDEIKVDKPEEPNLESSQCKSKFKFRVPTLPKRK